MKSNGISRNWKMRSKPLKNFCPQCQAYKPQSHKHEDKKQEAK